MKLLVAPVKLTIGIDATNLRQGGGRTHLIELLRSANPQDHGFRQVIVWGAQSTLALINDQAWLVKRNPHELEGGLIKRTLWQRFELSRHAKAERCDVLFVPGGSYTADFHPIITMSRNLLPFEWKELKRYGISFLGLKFLILRWTQSRSFRKADAVIFLTRYAQESVQRITGKLCGVTEIIPHGLSSRFIQQPKPQKPINDYSMVNPYRVLYVSIIDLYKHQWHIVEAMGKLRRKTGWPLVLDLIGPAYAPALALLEQAMSVWDPDGQWVIYHGAVSHAELPTFYEQADLGLFASSCENMPNILLETMAAGLPVACSERRPMPEILCEAGVYFNPEDVQSISSTLELLILDKDQRYQFAKAAYLKAKEYSWSRCANATFAFIAKVTQLYQKSS